MSSERTKRIAELNDRFRAALGIPHLCGGIPGQSLLTRGIQALDENVQVRILNQVRSFTSFNEDNDPYGERDFGSIEDNEAGKIFWKIDYYARSDCRSGSEQPENPDATLRILTIMLAEEY